LHTNPTAKNLFKGNLYLILLVLLFSSTWVYSHSNIGLEDQLNQAFDSGMYQEDGFISNPLLDLPSIWDRIPNGIYLAYRYLVFFIFPYPLLHDYGYAVVPVVQWTAPIVWLSLGIILGIAFLGYKFYRKSRGFLIGYLLFLAGISVFLHVVIPGPDHFAERFLFLPSVGLSIALVFALSLLLSKKAFGYVLCAVLLIFTSLTYHRNQDWASTFILLDSDIEKLQNCSRANFNYANELEFLSYKNPNPNQSNSMKLTALKHYSKSWKISKRSYKAIIAQGRLYMELGNYPKGLQSFKEAVKEYPQLIEPHLMLSKSYISVNQFDSSLVVLKKAEQTGMQIPDIYYLKGISYLKKNQLDSAIMSLYRCQNLKSENIEHYLLPAEMLITNGSYIKSLFVESKRDPLTEASKLLEDAQRIDPQNGKLKYLIEMLKNKSKSQ
jgi:tetratricopeptide (TPR) repeat protein